MFSSGPITFLPHCHRTLRRAHTARDRQTSLLRAERRALESAEASAGEDGEENAGDDADGYEQAVRIWSIKQAVERAKGRARAFLRRLWYALCNYRWGPGKVP